ncbi:hypothetical protein [Undibacterium curvum]|uniref:Uncharacterized protein n=1 Tax=Undibacterium curvum TaxID=2762294 RepID=A0ABR7A001_9BURK|nr:hypothetical protein [Undibacterium curvum]MBC3930227.1 hypothetical protein [Undibacterium curvum]
MSNAQTGANDLTDSAQLPRVELTNDVTLPDKQKLTSENAVFEGRDWQIKIRNDLLTRASLSSREAEQFAETLFHEVRHSEQTDDMLRYKEPTGWRFPLSDFKDDVVKMARANPLDARTVDGMAAKGY